MPTITFGARSFALIATGLALFALFALQESCPGAHPSGHERAQGGSPQERAGAPLYPAEAHADAPLSLIDFPPDADAPAGPYATRPRRPARLATRLRASSAALLQATGGPGFHPGSPAARSHGVRLHLTIVQSEEELVSLFLRGGDEGGADFIALSLERFVALLPRLAPALPKIFLLLSNSRGAEALVSTPKISAFEALPGRRLAYGRAEAGLYFLYWRLLREGVAPGALDLRQATSSGEALRWLRTGQVDAALVQDLDLAQADDIPIDVSPAPVPVLEAVFEPTPGEEPALADEDVDRIEEGTPPAPLHLHRLASTADAPLLVPQVLIGRGAFLMRYPEVARRTARALLAEAKNVAADPLPAARRLLEQIPTLPDPRASIGLDPPASLAENRAFFGFGRSPSPISYGALFESIERVFRKQGISEGHSDARDFFWETPLQGLSEKAIASTRMAPRPPAPKASPPVLEVSLSTGEPSAADALESEMREEGEPALAAPSTSLESDSDPNDVDEARGADAPLPLPMADPSASTPPQALPQSPGPSMPAEGDLSEGDV